MFSKKSVLVFVMFYFMYQSADCGIRKSWKALHFDSSIPKSTSIESENHSNNNFVKTTEKTVSSPFPSAETLKKKISSKIRSPPEYAAENYNLMKELQKDAVLDNENKYKKNNEVKEIFNEKVLLNNDESKDDETLEEQEDDYEVSIRKTKENSSLENEKDEITLNEFKNEENVEDDFEVTATETPNVSTTQYSIGKLMNVSFDSERSSVGVTLNRETLRNIFKGRGKKYGIIERVVPLFILPFIIQSAVVPFMVTMIKLLLFKSMFAGKIAVMLLILGALKNHQNNLYMKSMQSSPFSMKDSSYPERRMVTNAFEGYKVEGHPSAFIA
ncbi:CLUMA_CG001999, isoform A [Clunio marinus]|uniref:CLUMA_CG001999, isoform A n=1 Tax=Clunio marinus TaxID=568069 RepID=A0A1J1HL06_9DIPT|nr:CLUMA_CG001999, isoform A [Clunio marinus]